MTCKVTLSPGETGTLTKLMHRHRTELTGVLLVRCLRGIQGVIIHSECHVSDVKDLVKVFSQLFESIKLNVLCGESDKHDLRDLAVASGAIQNVVYQMKKQGLPMDKRFFKD